MPQQGPVAGLIHEARHWIAGMSPLRSDATVAGMPRCRLSSSIQAMNCSASNGVVSLVPPSSKARAREASCPSHAGFYQRSTRNRPSILRRDSQELAGRAAMPLAQSITDPPPTAIRLSQPWLRKC